MFNEQSGFLPKNAATGKYDGQTHFIIIRNVRIENSGIYICSGTYAKTIIKATGELKVVGKLCTFFCISPNHKSFILACGIDN